MAHIHIHIAAAVVAAILGAFILATRKGTPRHKALGRVAVVLMALVAAHSFAVRELNDGAFSGIHILSAVTLTALPYAIWQIRRRNIGAHKRTMIFVFIGFITAGILTLLPGRFLNKALLSLF